MPQYDMNSTCKHHRCREAYLHVLEEGARKKQLSRENSGQLMVCESMEGEIVGLFIQGLVVGGG
jgi:hypothetical protein